MMRFATEAYDQGGLLFQEDPALLLNSGRRTIQRDMAYLKKQEIIIPTRGSIQDIGPTISHKELRKFKIARILREAYKQKGVLSQADVAEMLGVSTGTVSKYIREYQIENQVVLPYRGTIHDLGRAITHKKMNIGHFFKNVFTLDISRITGHTEEASDHYIKAYKRVKILYGSMNQNEIARTMDVSESVVKEYIAIHEEFGDV